MEVGAVKQAFNNEVILLKKKLNQAKIQIIHKLTRKSKTFINKKCPDKLKGKLQKKADSAIKEVLIIKKLKAMDVAKFALTHTGELSNYLNKPMVDSDKVCARLLLHKLLQEKYKFLRNRFAGVPIKDLFMSREERRKLKKEARENKKKGKDKKENKIVKLQESKVSAMEGGDSDELCDENSLSGNEKENSVISDDKSDDESIASSKNDKQNASAKENVKFSKTDDESIASDANDELITFHEENANVHSENEDSASGHSDVKDDKNEKQMYGKFVRFPQNEDHIEKDGKVIEEKLCTTIVTSNKPVKLPTKEKLVKKDKKPKSKTKNLDEKILNRKFKKSEESSDQVNKVVDPFFVTATGENYLTVVEPRPPDEFKEIHRQGNRKMRRAAMFGHELKFKPKQNFEPYGKYEFHKNTPKDKFNERNESRLSRNDKQNFISRFEKPKVEENEKLHPSWEAKRKKSGILPFEGKKIVFDDS